MIKVITQTTAERNQELQELYQQVKPLIKKGDCPLRQAVKQVKGTNHTTFTKCAWYKELLKIAKNDGYKGR